MGMGSSAYLSLSLTTLVKEIKLHVTILSLMNWKEFPIPVISSFYDQSVTQTQMTEGLSCALCTLHIFHCVIESMSSSAHQLCKEIWGTHIQSVLRKKAESFDNFMAWKVVKKKKNICFSNNNCFICPQTGHRFIIYLTCWNARNESETFCFTVNKVLLFTYV